MQQIGSQYRDTCEQLRNFGLSASAPQKLAKLLLKFVLAVPSGRNRTSIHLPLTHERLAEYVGTTRETVTRILNHFEKRRLIERQGSTLVIRDRQALESLAQTE